LIVNSSKGVSSVFLGRYLGISQPAAWRMGHAIRHMMTPMLSEKLTGVVELDKTDVGGVFHYMSGKHLDRYLQEISFRRNHRIPYEKKTKAGKRKISWTPMPVMAMLQSVLNGATGKKTSFSK
jgi:hypothetical protein